MSDLTPARVVLLVIHLLAVSVALYAFVVSWRAYRDAKRTTERIDRILRKGKP